MSRQIKNKYVALAATTAMFLHAGLMAQQKGIDTIEVNVITRYKPTIHDAVKINNSPSVADTETLARSVKYDFVNTQYPTFYTPPQIPALQIKEEPPEERLYHSLLNAGLGNYNTLYGEYFFNSLRSHDMDYGFHLNHLSADYTTSGYGYSGYAFNNIDGYIEKSYNQHDLTAQAGFENHILHDYGYIGSEYPIVDNNQTKERYDLYSGSLDYVSHYRDSSKIGHDIKLKYYNLNDIYNAMENNVNADMKLFTYFNQQRIDVKAVVGYNSYTGIYDGPALGAAAPPTFNPGTFNVLFNPFFTTSEKHWDAHLGINACYATNQTNSSNSINVYPDLLARYHVAQDIVMIYAGIDGNQTYNTYKALTDLNPYIEQWALPLGYTYTQYHVFGGLTGTITQQLTYNINAAQSMIKDMPLFVPDSLEALKNKFTIVYDNVKVSNIHGDFDYKWKNNLSIILAADYNIYTTTNQLKAWYNPALKISATGRYTIERKYTLRAQFYVVGPQYAPDMVNGITTAKTLAGYPDLNLGVDYKYNKTFTAFLNLNNIANVGYYTWDNYEMERFNFLLGIRLGF